MTLKVKIHNDGNQATDLLVIKGVTPVTSLDTYPIHFNSKPGIETIKLKMGEYAVYYPECDHFEDFDLLKIKGKH